MTKKQTLVFSTQKYEYLKKTICRHKDYEGGKFEIKDFPDGERYQRIRSSVVNRDVVVIGGTVSDTDTLELYDLSSGLVRYGADRLTIVIPYFGYSTMERAIKEGEIVTAKTRARLFSAVPPAFKGNRVLLFDLHSEGLPHYFDDTIRPFHIWAQDIIVKIAKRIGGKDYVIACTDAGRAKWVQSLANRLGVEASFIYKKRLSARNTEVVAMSADVAGKHVLIYDDMIRTGGSLLKAAEAYKAIGAKKISAIATHGVFPEDSLERLQKSKLLKQIVVTDSHPRAIELKNKFLQVESISSLLRKHLRETY